MKNLFTVIKVLLVIILAGTLFMIVSSGTIVQNPAMAKFTAMGIIAITILLVISIYEDNHTNYKDNISIENTTNEFENLYKELYDKHISILEKKRKQARWRGIIRSSFLCYLYNRIISYKI